VHENCSDAYPRPLSGPGPTEPDYTIVCTLTVNGLTVVELSGEIDLAGAGLIGTHLDQVTATAGARIVVDLRRVGFIDASGLDPLVRARARALRRAGELSLICTDPRILRTLRLAGLLPGFPLIPAAPALPHRLPG
jgi:anti-sigma B factor antagonist